jgi:hypothetical protein
MVPIHETNSYDVKNYRSSYDLAENRKKRFTERVDAGTIVNYYSCGQPGHMSHDCPGA